MSQAPLLDSRALVLYCELHCTVRPKALQFADWTSKKQKHTEVSYLSLLPSCSEDLFSNTIHSSRTCLAQNADPLSPSLNPAVHRITRGFFIYYALCAVTCLFYLNELAQRYCISINIHTFFLLCIKLCYNLSI